MTAIDTPVVPVEVPSISTLAAIVVALDAHHKDIKADLDHYRSQLRHAIGGKPWSDDRYQIRFLPGFFKAIPCRRIDMGLVFKRTRLEPYMSVKRKPAK